MFQLSLNQAIYLIFLLLLIGFFFFYYRNNFLEKTKPTTKIDEDFIEGQITIETQVFSNDDIFSHGYNIQRDENGNVIQVKNTPKKLTPLSQRKHFGINNPFGYNLEDELNNSIILEGTEPKEIIALSLEHILTYLKEQNDEDNIIKVQNYLKEYRTSDKSLFEVIYDTANKDLNTEDRKNISHIDNIFLSIEKNIDKFSSEEIETNNELLTINTANKPIKEIDKSRINNLISTTQN